jgi:hypothetical protein
LSVAPGARERQRREALTKVLAGQGPKYRSEIRVSIRFRLRGILAGEKGEFYD